MSLITATPGQARQAVNPAAPSQSSRWLVLAVLCAGMLMIVVPQTQRLTTQEAADFLGVSRPTLVKLLEKGKIPYDQPGRHRRILFSEELPSQPAALCCQAGFVGVR
jgi:excisionase family DNA binding protein